jgi:hypothetical protein
MRRFWSSLERVESFLRSLDSPNHGNDIYCPRRRNWSHYLYCLTHNTNASPVLRAAAVEPPIKLNMFSMRQTRPIRPSPGVDASQRRLPNQKYVYMLTAFVSLGALLFGYDQGVSGPERLHQHLLRSLTSMKVMGIIVADRRWKALMQPANSWVCPEPMQMTTYETDHDYFQVTGAVVSLYDVGCFVGAMSVGFLADGIGRERSLSIASVVFIVGAVIQSASYGLLLSHLTTARQS